MKKAGVLATAVALTSLALPVTTPAAAALVAVHPFAAKAPDAAFHERTAADTGVSCTRPAPDGRVSTTIHCYTPDQIRSFYGLGPLASSNDGAGQTIVLVDSYGSPTPRTEGKFFARPSA